MVAPSAFVPNKNACQHVNIGQLYTLEVYSVSGDGLSVKVIDKGDSLNGEIIFFLVYCYYKIKLHTFGNTKKKRKSTSFVNFLFFLNLCNYCSKWSYTRLPS